MTENGSRGARRCLFGREDPERLSQDLAEQVKEEERASARAFERRWNFKIEDETPLQGRYQWEKIDNNRSVASTSTASLSRFPSSPVTAPEETVNVVVKTPPTESSDTEKSSAEDKSTLSSCSTAMSDSDVSKASLSSDEKDLNENIARESIKRKAPKTLLKDDTREPKRAKPP